MHRDTSPSTSSDQPHETDDDFPAGHSQPPSLSPTPHLSPTPRLSTTPTRHSTPGMSSSIPPSPHLSASPSAATPGSDPALPGLSRSPGSHYVPRSPGSDAASPHAHASHLHHFPQGQSPLHAHSPFLHFLPFQGSPVVADQRAKFESDELLRKLARESEIRYTSHRERPHEERVARFAADCKEKRVSVAFLSTGTNLRLVAADDDESLPDHSPSAAPATDSASFFDFEKETGKVHVSAALIFNGVCVKWVGVLDLSRMDGVGQLYFDEAAAKLHQISGESAVHCEPGDLPSVTVSA